MKKDLEQTMEKMKKDLEQTMEKRKKDQDKIKALKTKLNSAQRRIRRSTEKAKTQETQEARTE